MTKYQCRANNPATCRYHGSIHVHRKELAESLTAYKEVMVKQLRAGRVTPEMTALVQNASDTYWERQAVIDAHDSEYTELKKNLEALDYAKEGENPESLDEEFNLEYADTVKRIERAKAIRRAGKNEDNPQGLSYAAESGHNLAEAKNFLKHLGGGEFVGVYAGEPHKDNKEAVIVVGTKKSYSVSLDKNVRSFSNIYEMSDAKTPEILKSNPALSGANLRWKTNTVPYSDNEDRHVTHKTGYTVYNDKESIIVSTDGVIRQKTSLLSLQ